MDDGALLAAILTDPDDDLPRLVFADWLEERGEHDRSSFIRAQIELARTPPIEDRHAELTALCRQLEDRFRSRWLTSLPPDITVGQFERGFPVRVGPSLRDLPDRLLGDDDFLHLTQMVERFPLRVFSGRLLGAVSPSLVRFPQQSFYPARGESPLEKLARWPQLAQFNQLDLGSGGITTGHGDFQPGLIALAESPHTSNLTTLRLSGLTLGEDALPVLANSPHLGLLRSLDLRYNVPLQDRPASILETSLADRLEEIDGIDLETASRWLHRPGCRLRHLGITLDPHNDHPEMTDASPLIEAPGLANLRRLTLTFDGPAAWQDRFPERHEVLRVENLLEVLRSPLLANLEELNLCGVGLHPLEVIVLPGLPLARNLITLRLQRCKLKGNVMYYLRILLQEGRLRRVDLSCNDLTDIDAWTLARWPELRRLHELRLDRNTISSQGSAAITESPHAPPWLLFRG